MRTLIKASLFTTSALLLQSGAATAQQAGGDVVPLQICSATPGGANIANGGVNYKQVDWLVGSLELKRLYGGIVDTPNSPADSDQGPQARVKL